MFFEFICVFSLNLIICSYSSYFQSHPNSAIRSEMQNQKLISLGFAVAIIAAGISGAHMSEIKIMGMQLHGVIINDGMEWVPGPIICIYNYIYNDLIPLIIIHV